MLFQTLAEERQENLVGDCLLFAALTTYGGALDEDTRTRFADRLQQDMQEKGISAFSREESFSQVACAMHDACELHREGLPSSFYEVTAQRMIENALVAEHSTRCAVLIDPEGLASQWLQAKAAKGLATIVRMSDPAYIEVVKTAVGKGDLVAIDMDGLDFDLVLSSLLALRTLRKGKRNFLWVGSEFVECSKVGRIYLRTDLDDPRVPAHVRAMTTVVNFQVQESTAQDVFLAVMAAALDPDREERRAVVHRDVRPSKLAHASVMCLQQPCMFARREIHPPVEVQSRARKSFRSTESSQDDADSSRPSASRELHQSA